jgi:hypothetical protein
MAPSLISLQLKLPFFLWSALMAVDFAYICFIFPWKRIVFTLAGPNAISREVFLIRSSVL